MPNPETRLRVLFRLIAPPAIALAGALLLFESGLLATYENRLFDLQFRLRGPEADEPQRVAIVAIDDASLARHGAWPWPRVLLARLLARIAQGAPRAVGVDLLLDLPESEQTGGDAALEAVFQRPPDWILPTVFSQERSGRERRVLVAPLARFLTDRARSGVVNLEPDDSDRTIRRFRIEAGSEQLPFSAAVIAAAEKPAPDAIGLEGVNFRLGPRIIPLVDDAILINYKGAMIEHFSAADVIDDFFDPELFFRDRIVLVGRTDLASKDFFPTAAPGEGLLETESMAGVEIWKEAIDTILGDRMLAAPPLGPVLLLILAGGLLISHTLRAAPRWSAPLLIALLSAWLGLCHIAFVRYRLVFPASLGFLALYFTSVLSFLRQVMAEARIKRLIVAAFSSYVSPHVLGRILDHRLDLTVGGRRKNLTILFADIAGFTSFSEEHTAEEVVDFLKLHFDEMNRVIMSHDGIVDKLMGDGILAFFGDFTERDDHALQAVKAGLMMQERMTALRERTGHPLTLRIGINTGPVIVGNVGSDEHFEYTVIGGNVNLAQRLEANCPAGDVLISDATRERLGDAVRLAPPETFQLKGIKAPVTAHRVIASQAR